MTAADHNEWFDAVYRQYADQLFKITYAIFRDEELSKDIVQDVFLVLLVKQDSVSLYERLDIWLKRVLKNRIGNELKKLSHQTVSLEEETLTVLSTEDDHHLIDLLPSGLSESDKQLLIWYYDEKLDYEEIAARLGRSVLTCRTKVCRAKKRCRDLLIKNFSEPV